MQARKTLNRFFKTESSSSILLFASMCFALIWENSSFHSSYEALWKIEAFKLSLENWVNDGLMSVFFFVVGLEIRREFAVGELSTRKKATLPVSAALGGMLVPAILYAAINWRSTEVSGWGIPMATDIAFTLGALSLLGDRISKSLKVFLTALAIVDDLGAVLVIALFYTSGLSWPALLAGILLLAMLRFCNRFKKIGTSVYLVFGLIIWACFLKSGIHPTIAGVLLAMVVPFSSITRLESSLHPWVAFGVLPIFALSNSGVSFSQSNFTHRISLGILFGLVLGKQIGISLFSWISVKLNLAALPEHSSWSEVYGISCLAGMGFTMSIFIAQLALSPEFVAMAKISVLLATLISFTVGLAYLKRLKTKLNPLKK